MTTAPEPYASREVITPKKAEQMLATNTNNRNVRPRKVDVYANEMKSGDWVVTGEGVKFDTDGRMFDGQHRLLAVVRSGVPAEMFVFRNLPPAAALVVDTGTRRSPADALKLSGYGAYPAELGAMAKVVLLWDRGALRRSGQGGGRVGDITNVDIVEWVDEFAEDALHWIPVANRVYKVFPSTSKAILAAALYLISRVDPEGAAWFADEMHSGRLPGRGHPLNALHARITAAKVRREVLRPAGALFLYFRTWNAIAAGESLSQLKIGKTGTSDITVPSPKARKAVSA